MVCVVCESNTLNSLAGVAVLVLQMFDAELLLACQSSQSITDTTTCAFSAAGGGGLVSTVFAIWAGVWCNSGCPEHCNQDSLDSSPSNLCRPSAIVLSYFYS